MAGMGREDIPKRAKNVSSRPENFNERQWRLFLALQAQSMGRGGIRWVSQHCHISSKTVRKGIRELGESCHEEAFLSKRARKKGGGRKSICEKHPGLRESLIRSLEQMDKPSLREISKHLESEYHIRASPTSISKALEVLGLKPMFSEKKRRKKTQAKKKAYASKKGNDYPEKLLQVLEQGFRKNRCGIDWILEAVGKSMGVKKDIADLENSKDRHDRELYLQVVKMSIDALRLNGKHQAENGFFASAFPKLAEELLLPMFA